jgi:hypothetical protein
VGQAFSFNGSDASVDVPYNVNLNIQNELTIEAWVMKAGPCKNNCIVVVKQDDSLCCASYRYGLLIFGVPGVAPGRASLSFNTGIWTDVVISNTVLQDNLWYHLAGTYDGQTAKIYVNGLLDNAVSQSGLILASVQGSLFIGQDEGGFGDEERFEGLIDELEIYERALSAEEVAGIFHAGAAGKCKVIPVGIDIKPRSFPNSINPRSNGRIPVAILATDTFDPSTVDANTIVFGPKGARPEQATREDVDGDGDIDVILHFSTQATGIQCGDTSATLRGEALDGVIEGSDSIITVGCH